MEEEEGGLWYFESPCCAASACEIGGVEKQPSGSHRDKNTKFIFNFHSSFFAIAFYVSLPFLRFVFIVLTLT